MRLPLIAIILSVIVQVNSRNLGYPDPDYYDTSEVDVPPSGVSRRFLGGMIGNLIDKTALRIITPSENANKAEVSQKSSQCGKEAWTDIAYFILTMIKRIFQLDDGKPASRGTAETFGGILYFGVTMLKRILVIDSP